MKNTTYKVFCVASILYLSLSAVFLLWHQMWFSPDQFFAAAIIGALLLGRLQQFIQDWISPILLFLSYEYLRGLAPILTKNAHVWPMINFDKFFFGTVPTISLQSALFSGTLHWYDYAVAILYESHFVVFLLVGFIFWLWHRQTFRQYYLALIILSYMAFITYVLFPAVPPWMASQNGYLPPLKDILPLVFNNLPRSVSLPTVYQFFGANLVAAVPSLHAAYPWLTFLVVTRKIRFFGLLLLPYVFGVWFAIVYLGEHYIFDIVAGCLYATVAFFLVTRGRSLLTRIQDHLAFAPTEAFLSSEPERG